MIGKFVLVRTRSAGVHCGILLESAGTAVVLENARRIWRWSGARTLNEMAVHGCSLETHTRISGSVSRILLTEAIEVIPCTEQATENLSRSRWL